MMKNVHSIFEYIFNTERQDTVSGKTRHNLLTRYDNIVAGVLPPEITQIMLKHENIIFFVKALFYK